MNLILLLCNRYLIKNLKIGNKNYAKNENYFFVQLRLKTKKKNLNIKTELFYQNKRFNTLKKIYRLRYKQSAHIQESHIVNLMFYLYFFL